MSKRIPILTLLFLAAGFVVGVQAQTTTVGNISGTVHDPNGAGIPKAEVLIVQPATSTSRTAITDENGNYSAPSLPAGSYTVTVTATGFKKTVNTDVELHVGENKVLNLELQVGQFSETVTVTGEGTQVETRVSAVTSLVTERQVTELPLNGRNYAQLVTMVPGVSPVTQS